jgi:AcrR family transcriptional regulator
MRGTKTAGPPAASSRAALPNAALTRVAEPSRLSREVRRDALLDAALALIGADGVEAVSMEAVAEGAGVSRPLVYKHFANRGELLAAVYRRESLTLHYELAAEVAAAGSLEDMHRILIRGSLRAAKERGPVFVALRQAGAWNRDLRREQRGRDRDTVRAFAGRAVRERQLDRAAATSATVVVLGAIDPLLAQWRRRPTAAHARLLEEIYLNMVRAAYSTVPPAEPAG